MKEVIALLWAICIVVVAIYLLVYNNLGKASATILFALAILGGLAIANYDLITNFKYKGFDIQLTRDKAVADANAISKIKKRIEDQSATVDLVASRATNALKLSEEATEKNKLAEKELKKIQTTLSETENKLSTVETLSAFQSVIAKAQNDDRQAYDQLSAWENDNQSPFQQHALIAKINIRLQYGERLGSGRGISSVGHTWKEGVEPSTLTISQLIDDYNKTAWHFRSGLTGYIWERDDFSKKDRMQFLIDTLKKERNLKAVCIAQYFLSKEANIKFNPLVIEPLLEWWEKNKGIYNKNPEDQPTDSPD